MFGTLFCRRRREAGPHTSRRRRPWTRSENPSVSTRAMRSGRPKLCLRVQLDRAQSLSTLRVSASSPNNAAGVLQPCAPPVTAISSLAAAAVRTRASTQDETAWTVALHLSPWGAAQQIPRESRQDARTGVLWGRRAKRRQPSRPPVNRARHSQVPTDAARPKNTSAAARKKKLRQTTPGTKKSSQPRAGVWTPSDGRVKRTKCKRLLGPRGFLTYTCRERRPPRA